jgi:hypothetical protein
VTTPRKRNPASKLFNVFIIFLIKLLYLKHIKYSIRKR